MSDTGAIAILIGLAGWPLLILGCILGFMLAKRSRWRPLFWIAGIVGAVAVIAMIGFAAFVENGVFMIVFIGPSLTSFYLGIGLGVAAILGWRRYQSSRAEAG